ncbi:hypothetical protein HHK36_025065 [Tetracentron sinense]|uniref:Protein SIEVE ELEMENT OCCLUSION C n=1 Tax=Tetracentron sinense TaxID=13715 RepID=A0A835D4U7_TETSI|nr:hypothetical protein HHK36_025065 [Tetracentron sinense]
MYSFRSILSNRSPSVPQEEEDNLLKKILLTHDPDGRRVDSESLLHAMENIMCYASSTVSEPHLDAIAMNAICNSTELFGSQEALGHTIYKISCELLCKCSGDGDILARTMALFDLLGNYAWDAKVVLVLAAFATSYGEFWLIMQLYPLNPLAVSIAMLKKLPKNLVAFKPCFKALSLLIKTMVNVAKCIIKFEGLPVQQVKLDDKAMVTTKSQIYIATYWIIRSAFTCSSLITDMVAMNNELQVHVLSLSNLNLVIIWRNSNFVCPKPYMHELSLSRHSTSTTIATWELSSLVYRMSGIYSHLRRQLDTCELQMEAKMHHKLLNLFNETHVDNHEVLHMLFALKDDLPLKGGSSSQAKIGVSELLNKEVILLVSKPELLPLEELFLLVQQIYDQPHHKKLEGSYDIIWVPIPSSSTWTDAEEKDFNRLSNSLPWYSIRQPWLLSSAVVNHIKQVWQFEGHPLMVVLDPQGRVTNSNAIDMVLIWGAMAYPFSTVREVELWEEAKWTLQLMIDEIDPLISMWVEDGRTLCLYESDNIEWIREFTSKVKKITSAGVRLELVYVGKSNPSENLRSILSTIVKEKLSGSLSFTKIRFFWLRLESMRRSKARLGKTVDADHILEEVVSLLDLGASEKGWAVMGKGLSTDIVKLQGRKLMELLNLSQVWGEKVEKVGFLGAIRSALEPPLHVDQPCYSSNVVPYIEGSTEGTVVCEECKRPMEKHILYQCHVID